MAPRPDVARFQIWKPGTGQDPAKFLINPGQVTAPGRHSPGNLRHARPYMANGSTLFVFPVGTEGFRRSGASTLAIHKYIGDNTVDGQTIHYEEGSIEMNGVFPGLTSRDCMIDCISMLRSRTGNSKIVLYVPGVFEREQYVLPEDWEFTHSDEDRTHSIDYRITFKRVGEGRGVKDPHGAPPPPNPSQIKLKPKGKPSRVFVIKDGARTLRMVANEVYGNQNRWTDIVQLNEGQLRAWNRTIGQEVPHHSLGTYRWAIGTKFRY